MSEKCGVCRILLYRLKVALVVVRFDILLARKTSYLSTMMIVNTDSSNDTLTFLAFDQETAQTFSGTGIIFMSGESFFSLEEPVAVFAKLPLDEGTVLCSAWLAKIPPQG